MRAISTESMPQRIGRRRVGRRRRGCQAAAARTTSAASVPAKPRHTIERDVAARRLRAFATTAAPAHSGASDVERRNAGHRCCLRSAASASVVSRMPAAAIRCPIAHLNAVTGGHCVAEHAPQRRRFGCVGLRRAVAVRDDHADVASVHAGVGQRGFDRADDARRRRRGSPAGPARRRRCRRRALRLAPARSVRARTSSVSSTSAPAPSPNKLPLRARSNGRSPPVASSPQRW